MNKKTTIIVFMIAFILLIVGVTIGITSNSKSNKTVTKKPSVGVVVNNSVLSTGNSSNYGNYLTDKKGNALYLYILDKGNISNCTGTCIAAWPAFIDKGSTSGLPTNISSITRTDNGSVQYTYKSKPLYYFKYDTAGKTAGNNLTGFTLAKP